MTDRTDLELVVTDIQLVAERVRQVTLARTDGHQLPAWSPGAHIDLRLSDSAREYVRQYSLCGDPADRESWTIAVLHVPDSRGGSSFIHSQLAVGQKVSSAAPRNNFPLRSASRYLFIAGGIGITPILPMIEDVSSRGAEWNLIYCGRSEESMAFTHRIEAMGSKRVEQFTSSNRPLHDLSSRLSHLDEDTHVYCCGPERMVTEVRSIGRLCAQDRIHVERFQSSERPADAVDTEFEVEFSDSGLRAQVPCGRSILDVAEDLGISVESSCQEGVCGTCETRVLAGTPEHRDDVLTDDEREAGETMMICVSRARSTALTLEL